MPKKRSLITSREALEVLKVSRNALRLLRLQGQLSTIEKDDDGRAAPAGGFWYDAAEVKKLAKIRGQMRQLQESMKIVKS